MNTEQRQAYREDYVRCLNQGVQPLTTDRYLAAWEELGERPSFLVVVMISKEQEQEGAA